MTTDVRESRTSDFSNSHSSIPGLNSSDPSARDDYWSAVAAIVSATLFRGARPHSNSPASDAIPVIDFNSPASVFFA